ncbi:MAG: hypothetical protein LCH53_14610 [Bacteroidetes bacterium]|nr:hypothetical protein [Bacteroidota bacterium]
MTHLTGPPRIAGYLLPRPSLDTPTRVEWVPEHITKTMRSGAVRVLETRYRARVTMGWQALPLDTVHVLLSVLRSAVVAVVPRTKAPSDPAWANEVEMMMRVTSDLPSSAQLWTAPRTLPVTLELESLAAYDDPQGLVEAGGYIATAFTSEGSDGAVEIAPYGAATVTPGGETYGLTFMGETFALPTVTLGTDGIADTHLTATDTPEGTEDLLTRDLP